MMTTNKIARRATRQVAIGDVRKGGNAPIVVHLGLTEAGMGSKGIVPSSAATSVLLQEGIGDGVKTVTLKGQQIAQDFQRIVDAYVRRTYGGGAQRAGVEKFARKIPANADAALAVFAVRVAG